MDCCQTAPEGIKDGARIVEVIHTKIRNEFLMMKIPPY
jgi:hypothetical protein